MDFGLANGPKDKRTFAEMLMDRVISKGHNPHEDCSCGGTFKQVPDEDEWKNLPEALREFVCDKCDERTYDWNEEYERRVETQYFWE